MCSSRDEKLIFCEETHTYTVDDKNLTSVTTLISSFFPPFDAPSVVDKMMLSPRWSQSKYFGQSKEEIINSWKELGETASRLGTQMHQEIEDYFLSDKLPPSPSVEFKQFLQFWKDFSKLHEDYVPYRAEWRVYSEKIAGSIDMTLMNSQGKIILIDWKRSKEIRFFNKYTKGFGPLEHIEDCNYMHYCLQLNCYRVILEKYYDKEVEGMFLAVFHPNKTTYNCIKVPRMKEGEVFIE